MTVALVAGLSFDELARRVGRRFLRQVLEDELESGRVVCDGDRYALALEAFTPELLRVFRDLAFLGGPGS